jgi:hypothetical protein
MSDPEISRCSGYYMLRFPNRLAMKCRDPKTNLELGENLVKA